ncbi:MAG: hypothetical protein R3E86_19285 [Pseudomonadales bacterium]
MSGRADQPTLGNLPWRAAGVALMAVCVILYDTDAVDVWNRLVLPVAMAVAAWLMVQNLVAVAFGALLLAGIHSETGSADWIPGRAYPVLAVVAGVILTVELARRFRRRIAETHAARWAGRSGRSRQDRGAPR